MNENGRLDGWKEIANYVERSVKTVQRWEKQDGFPIKRIGDKRSIYALTSEVEDWLKKRNTQKTNYSQLHLQSQRKKLSKKQIVLICLLLSLLFISFSIIQRNRRIDTLKQRLLFTKVEKFSDGSLLRIVDDKNNVLKEFKSSNSNYLDIIYNNEGRKFHKFVDLNDDGILDLVLTDYENNNENFIKIFITDLTGNLTEFRKINLQFSYFIDSEEHKQFRIKDMVVVDMDGDGVDEIIVSQNSSLYFPSITRVFKLNGKEVFRIINPGHISNIIVRDLDKDGKKELLIGACNNRLHKYSLPVVIAIKSDWIFLNKTVDLIQFGKTNCKLEDSVLITYMCFPYISDEEIQTTYQYATILKTQSPENLHRFRIGTFPIKEGSKKEQEILFDLYSFGRKFILNDRFEVKSCYLRENYIKMLDKGTLKELERKYLQIYYYNGQSWQKEVCQVDNNFFAFKEFKVF